MKKITTLLLAFLFSAAIFAFPKYDGTFKNNLPEDLYDSNKAIQYIDNSCQNLYALAAVVHDGDNTYKDPSYYEVYISNFSLVSKVEIVLILKFSNEKELEDFILTNMYTANIEEIFINIRQLFTNQWLKPRELSPHITTANRKMLKKVVYEAFYSELCKPFN